MVPAPTSTNTDSNKDRPAPKRAPAVFIARIGAVVLLLAGIIMGGVIWGHSRNGSARTQPIPTMAENVNIPITPTPEPTTLSIPRLNITAPFIKLGLAPDHTLEVPPGSSEVGWYIHAAKPGDIGPAVVVGHLDTTTGPAVFAHLDTLTPGDLITISRADGSTVTYKVDSLSKYSQDNFPTQNVYGPIDYAGLRLITCAGTYSKQKRHYSDNLVVYASLVKPVASLNEAGAEAQ